MMSIPNLKQLFSTEIAEPRHPQPGDVHELRDGRWIIILELDYDCEVYVVGHESGTIETGSHDYWFNWHEAQLVQEAV